MSITDDPLLKKYGNLYDVLGVLKQASVKEIKSAYRKKALECHPDKNPDDPKAAELFHELTRVLEILIDDNARVAYDRILTAKLAAKQRNDALDSRRKRLKEDLEERERQAQEKHNDWRTDEKKFEQEVNRLRKEASEQVKMEMENVRRLIKESKIINSEKSSATLKLKWAVSKNDSGNGKYSESTLKQIFSKYGSLCAVIISSKKKGSALVEFSDSKAAINACKLEQGFADNPLKITPLGGSKPMTADPFLINVLPGDNNPSSNKGDSEQVKSSNIYDDFEEQVLKKLREAEMNKRKINEALT